MNSDWKNFLTQQGAVFEDDSISAFSGGDEASTGSDAVLTDLSSSGLIRLTGDDTSAFLQGQLTNDVRAVTPSRAQYTAYCTPKGRMLASFLMWRDEQNFFLQLPKELQPTIQKRLTMFVLRSKVTLTDATSDYVRLGLSGTRAAEALTASGLAAPGEVQQVMTSDDVTVVHLPGPRFLISCPVDTAPTLWKKLSATATPSSSAFWRWTEIRAGIPTILPATQEQFVPQMVNYEIINGVSFKKGCYPGQEIVARTQYLGKSKRRMYLARLSSTDELPRPGDDLFTPELEGQSAGTVVNAERAPDGATDLLAVLQISARENSDVHWKTPDGPLLSFQELPYPVGE